MHDATHPYRGRIAPSPTGYLHLGHARTFWIAWKRARASAGKLVLRNEDLDVQRSRPEFVRAVTDDLHWLGLDWDEGPDKGGPFAPYSQSERHSFYLDAWRRLRDGGYIYPCTCSRKDLERALEAPHEPPQQANSELAGGPGEPPQQANSELAGGPGEPPQQANSGLAGGPGDDDEIPYPGTCRHRASDARSWESPAGVSWRFAVPDEAVTFDDLYYGTQSYVAGKDFTDFLIWRRDDVPAYQLAVVVDDAEMRITEVVRGADLLKSTARQLLLFRALDRNPPRYFHCPLLRDEHNVRLAKRNFALSLSTLREQGVDPRVLTNRFAAEIDWSRRLVNR